MHGQSWGWTAPEEGGSLDEGFLPWREIPGRTSGLRGQQVAVLGAEGLNGRLGGQHGGHLIRTLDPRMERGRGARSGPRKAGAQAHREPEEDKGQSPLLPGDGGLGCRRERGGSGRVQGRREAFTKGFIRIK